jgi:hypothetical protein
MHFLAAWRHNRKLAAITKKIETAGNPVAEHFALQELIEYSVGNLGIGSVKLSAEDEPLGAAKMLNGLYDRLVSGGLEVKMAAHAIST